MIDQRQLIEEAERDFNIGPVELARRMGCPYATLKDWKAGRYTMPGVAVRCLELLHMVRAAGLEV